VNSKDLVATIFRYIMLTIFGVCLTYISVSTEGDLQVGAVVGLIFYAILTAAASLRPD